ncbi:lactonase family protein [Flagellimonas aequoris]|uniref:Lactonase family protein n=1 Tax=Flagellimonas aequoris TaxID=2306997 RepID=A0A418N8T7_9FLAO|nr:lactonase family protein [Allomuricauda aequoris]RIV71529.1 lactonase family protein [Allomuricauda aequoris]TXK03094.1 lactonase family protein [Allomuricauda aequoris]
MWMTFFIGSYTEYPIPGFGGVGQGIYTVSLNTKTGELKHIHSKKERNPSYLAISNDNRFLYCPTELDETEFPRIGAYKINSDFSLDFLNGQPISGGYPCHVAVDSKSVFVACYATGNIIQYPLCADGKLGVAIAEYQHQGIGMDKDRQEGPHTHQIEVHPNGKDIYVCDLGIDTIKAYRYDGAKLSPNAMGDCPVSKGSGPRHLVFDSEGGRAYVINELKGKISVLGMYGESYREIDVYPFLPKNYMGKPSASAIRIHPNGQFLYAANRGSETITVFSIAKEKLELVGYEHTGGEELREFNITPDGNWLLACHQNSHDIVVYNINGNGMLSEKFRTKEILSPVCVAFLN